ncbi:MAG TPA: AAA family ATPase, partial [Candidatus Nanopelagicales bacterium]|nr:AAA family ATPase [Candidatus Nanopelagicales bacterium]
MKLAGIQLQNFRQFRHLELDFTDSLGRIRDVSMLVGPNASGKTSVLDAIALAIGPTTKRPSARPDLVLSPANIVRHGAVRAHVTCRLVFTEEEIEATRQLFKIAEEPTQIPDATEVTLTWSYPDEGGQQGQTQCEPEGSFRLLQARAKVAQLFTTRAVDWSWFSKVGAIFTFDQQRLAWAKRIPPSVWEVIQGGLSVDASADGQGVRASSDPRVILLAMAIKAKLKEGGLSSRQLEAVAQRFAIICSPHRLLGATENPAGEAELHFIDGDGNEYLYEGLSSGQRILLAMLVRMVSDHVHRSLVLVDEAELHLHPVWQQRLL